MFMFTVFFVFNDTATTEIYTYCHTLSLHDALPIWREQDHAVAAVGDEHQEAQRGEDDDERHPWLHPPESAGVEGECRGARPGGPLSEGTMPPAAAWS